MIETRARFQGIISLPGRLSVSGRSALGRLSAALILGLTLTVLGSSCSGYDQLLRSDNIDLKYEEAKKYYNKGSYVRALPLLKQLLTLYKGTEKEPDIMYYVAYSHYGQGELLLASALFKNFYNFFPNDPRAQETHFMSARCLALASPKVSLDQTVTFKAIDAFQLFINTHPTSDSVAAANQQIDLLRGKLERKAIEGADLYYHTRNFQAAAVAYEEILRDFPDIDQSERIQFQIIKSYWDLANVSVVCKQEERYGSAVDAYNEFVQRFPESGLRKEADQIAEKSRTRKVNSKEDCTESERVRKLVNADLALRNKDLDKAIHSYKFYTARYSDHETADEARLNLIRAHVRKAQEEEIACKASNSYSNALEVYYRFIEVNKHEELTDDAEKLYQDILEGQDAAKKACDEHN